MTLKGLGEELGFEFNYHPDTMRYNSFKSHQLLHFSRYFELEHAMKVSLFRANFTFNKNISDSSVLVEEAVNVGLDAFKSRKILEEMTYAQAVREEQKYWQEIGIVSIPFFIINKDIVIQGAPEFSYLREQLSQVIKQHKTN